MKVLRDKQTGTKKVKKIVHHEDVKDEFGTIIEEAFEEEIEIEIPVFERVYEEVDDLPQQEEIPHSPTPEERIQALEKELAELKEALK